MVTQLFRSSVAHHQPTITTAEAIANVIALPSAIDALANLGITLPATPKQMATPIHIHKYRGRFRENFVVEGSPYGDQWLSQTTASVETEAVKWLTVFKAMNPTGMIFLLGSLLPVLLLLATLQLVSLPYDAIALFFSGH
jgi:hypothetical protein